MSETTATAFRINERKDSHWYYLDGRPCYELPKKDGSGMKNPTLADARKLALMPSVTTVLKLLAKPELERWKILQACMAVRTTPMLPNETEDAFFERVLNEEQVQNQEAIQAADKGKALHDELERLSLGIEAGDPALREWVISAWEHVCRLGINYRPEVILCGDGYAGKADLIMDADDPEWEWVIDYKSTKTLPTKASWDDHRLQLAAYAKAQFRKSGKRIKTGNLYVSSIEPRKYAFFENPPWEIDYEAFRCAVKLWQWKNNYVPMAS